jgi:uncharacterized Zn finger protein
VPESNSDSFADGDGHIHADANSDSHGDVHADTDCDCHVHTDCNCNGDSYGDSNGNSNCDHIAAAYAHATASADTAAATLALFGIKGNSRDKLASSQLQIHSKSLTNAGRALHKKVCLHLKVLKQSTHDEANNRRTMATASRLLKTARPQIHLI